MFGDTFLIYNIFLVGRHQQKTSDIHKQGFHLVKESEDF